jgi:putative heme degradation protein
MDIRQAYADARAAGATRHRDIALSLGVTEGMLPTAACRCSACGATSRACCPS